MNDNTKMVIIVAVFAAIVACVGKVVGDLAGLLVTSYLLKLLVTLVAGGGIGALVALTFIKEDEH